MEEVLFKRGSKEDIKRMLKMWRMGRSVQYRLREDRDWMGYGDYSEVKHSYNSCLMEALSGDQDSFAIAMRYEWRLRP